QANSRVKTLRVTGDKGYEVTLAVADRMGSQILQLPTPFTGRTLTLSVSEAYRGNKYEDLVVSELRFFDGSQWFMLNPVERLKTISEANRSAFKKAGLEAVLNHGLFHGDDEWVLRVRADGSMYLQG